MGPCHKIEMPCITSSSLSRLFRHLEPVSLIVSQPMSLTLAVSLIVAENKAHRYTCVEALPTPTLKMVLLEQGLMGPGVRPEAEKRFVGNPKDGGNRTEGMSDLHLASIHFEIPFILECDVLWCYLLPGAVLEML